MFWEYLLRALLAEDVKLDLVNRMRLAGRKDVSDYFTRYSGANDWKFAAGIADLELTPVKFSEGGHHARHRHHRRHH